LNDLLRASVGLKYIPCVSIYVLTLIIFFIPSSSKAQVSQTVEFQTGWNLYSYWFDPFADPDDQPGIKVEDLLAEVSTEWKGTGDPPLKLVYRWCNESTNSDDDPATGTWKIKFLNPPGSVPDFPDTEGMEDIITSDGFGELVQNEAYFLYFEFPNSISSYEFTTSGTLVQQPLEFKRGWNLKGLPLDVSSASGTSTQLDFESVLRGAGANLTEVYGLRATGGTGFVPLAANNTGVAAAPYLFEGSFASGRGNWFYAVKDFELTPQLRTVFAPDSDFGDDNLGQAPNINEGDEDRNRYFDGDDVDQNLTNLGDGIIENGEYVQSIVFRFQPADGTVDDVIPFTITNRGTVNPSGEPDQVVAAEDSITTNDGQGVLAYNIQFRPILPEADITQWNPESGMPNQTDYLVELNEDGSGGGAYPESSPYRNWLQVLMPGERRVRLPDGRVDPVLINEAVPLSQNPITGFVSNDVAGVTLLADRTGLPINTDTSSIDDQGAPKPVPGFAVHGEILITSNAAPPRRVLVRCEVPPLAGMFEGVAYITRVNGVEADPAFPIDLSLSLFEDSEQKLRGIIDSERVLLYPRDVPLTGTKLTSTGSRYVFTGSFFLPPGDINRAPYDRFNGLPPVTQGDQTVISDTGDVDFSGDNTYDNTNPFPYQIERSMAFFVDRNSDISLSGDFIETLSGLTDEPVSLEGEFELLRISYDPRKRESLSWFNSRRIQFDPTGTKPSEEIRSTVEIGRPLRIDEIDVTLGIEHPRVDDLQISLLAPDLSEYSVFPINTLNENESDDELSTGAVNFDGDSGNLFEVISSRPSPNDLAARKRLRRRRNPDLDALKGISAGSAALYGDATVENRQANSIPVVLDSTDTFSFIDESDLLEGTETDSTVSVSGEKVVLKTKYFVESDTFLADFPFACTLSPTEPDYDFYSSLLSDSNSDPAEKDTIVSIIVTAEPNPVLVNEELSTDWLRDINAYRLALSYPTNLLEFEEALRIPDCEGVARSILLPDPIFNATPVTEERVGSVIISGNKVSDNEFTGGPLFVARFRVKAEDLDLAEVWPDDIDPNSDDELTSVPLNIGANETVMARISIPDGGRIQDLNLTSLGITHPSIGDLIISLMNPDGEMVTLMDREGGDFPNASNLTFDDQASETIQGAAAPFNGTYRPQGDLEDLFLNNGVADTQTGGIWKLIIENTSNREGKLNTFGLQFSERMTQDYAISLSQPPSVWTLLIRDNVEGPLEPVPAPQLVRWGISIETSGGSIEGRVRVISGEDENGNTTFTDLPADLDPPVRVSLLGREFVPSLNVPPGVTSGEDELQDGNFRFTGQEFGIYTILVTHPDYESASTRELFFEDTGSVLDIGTIGLKLREGLEEDPRDEEDDDGQFYELVAQPWEQTIITRDNAQTTASVRVELRTEADPGFSFGQNDKLHFTLTPFDIDNQVVSICDNDGITTTTNPSIADTPTSITLTAPTSGSIFGFNVDLLPGTYELAVELQDQNGMPLPFPNVDQSMTSTTMLMAEREVIIRTDETFPLNDGMNDLQNLFVSRYSFGTGTTNKLLSNDFTGCDDITTRSELFKRNYFLRDQAGFDIDRPSVYFDALTITTIVSDFPLVRNIDEEKPNFTIYDVSFLGAQDSWNFFRYENSNIDALFPEYENSTQPTGGTDDRYEFYPRDKNGNQLRYRATLSFNSQISGVGFGTLTGLGIGGGNLGTVVSVGEMPLIPNPTDEPTTTPINNKNFSSTLIAEGVAP